MASSISGSLAISKVSIFGSGDGQTKIKEFSDEVSSYVTSDKMISEISKNVGEPKTNETEEEFVERASCVLREVLNKKFDV